MCGGDLEGVEGVLTHDGGSLAKGLRRGANWRAASPMRVTRLLLVRHGATTATEEDRFSGSTGAELSDKGRWQAARLGERLSNQNITAIYSSPLSRALETARIVAGHCRLEFAARDGLREIGHGHWEGMNARTSNGSSAPSMPRGKPIRLPSRRPRRVGRGGPRPRVAGDPRDRHCASRRAAACRLPQSHPPDWC